MADLPDNIFSGAGNCSAGDTLPEETDRFGHSADQRGQQSGGFCNFIAVFPHRALAAAGRGHSLRCGSDFVPFHRGKSDLCREKLGWMHMQ